MSAVTKVARMVASTMREYGVAGTMAKLIVRPFGVRHARFDKAYDRWWDRRLGIRTTAFLAHDELTATDAASRDHATLYHAYPYGRIRYVYRVYRAGFQRPDVRPRFVDVGCGEGRLAFFWASRGFEAHGIDFDARLVERARANADSFRSRRAPASFEVGDARAYRLDRRPTIVSLFNPFDATILEPFIANNLEVLGLPGSIVIYMHDHHADTLDRAGLTMVFRQPSLKISFWAGGAR